MGIFSKRPKAARLQKKYEKLMADWHRLSTINRAASDAKYAEAQDILEQIEALQK
ncbi:MAG: Lacal_2735 family protein [Flavobacteriaceae bacterium]|nr:Lacal_2735 family protein [Bacteroidia bacterium]MBT8287909.1 Lacal_2735 family protein [Bacteroidia bacterium]NNF74527.1 Lacal_2735 family protein [Flavobacteriaceae bacterium]NNK72122.1 Lacal_2735 family protein [Flavobacteriaceae bacterium]